MAGEAKGTSGGSLVHSCRQNQPARANGHRQHPRAAPWAAKDVLAVTLAGSRTFIIGLAPGGILETLHAARQTQVLNRADRLQWRRLLGLFGCQTYSVVLRVFAPAGRYPPSRSRPDGKELLTRQDAT